MSTGRIVPLAASGGLELAEYRCTACRGDRPYLEEHRAISASVVVSGSFSYLWRGRTQVLVPGALLLGEPGEQYACAHDHDGGDRCLTLRFDAARIAEVLTAGGLRGEPERPFGDAVVPPQVRLAARLFAVRAAAGGDGVLPLEEAAYDFAWELLCELERARGERRSVSRTPAPTAAEIERALHAAAYIEAQAAEPLSLADVAAQVGLSRFHFLRLFRRVVGLTPHQLLLRARIRRAAELLLRPESGRGGRDSITDIAYGVGFGDLSNFVRTFGRLVGCSPRQWRRGGLRAQRNILQERLRRKR